MSKSFVPIIPADLGWVLNSPFSLQFDNAFYFVDGSFENNTKVFIEGNHLLERWLALDKDNYPSFTIAETGFGVALNFLLTWYYWDQYAPKTARLNYISCEKHPLKKADLQRCVANWPQLAVQAQQLIDNYPILTPGYHHILFEKGRVTLSLMLGDAFECYEQLLICGDSQIESQLRTAFIDAWYLDGFSPSINKSMWSQELMGVIAKLSGNLTTFAAVEGMMILKTRQRHPERREGPPATSKMLADCHSEEIPRCARDDVRRPETPWHYSLSLPPKEKSALIVGAGLAGCFTAYSLAQRGWKVTLIEELKDVGCSASANPQAVLFPKLSAYQSPLSQLMLAAFLYASQFYKKILKQHRIGELEGSLLLAYNDREKKALQSLKNWLSFYPELGSLVSAQQGTKLCGLALHEPGLFISLSGWMNSPELCKFLINSPPISLITGQEVKSIAFDGFNWKTNDIAASVLILANGNKAGAFPETSYLPIQSLRGQMSSISTTKESSHLKIPLCAEGHVLPGKNGAHWLGASFDLGNSSTLIDVKDDVLNLAKLPQSTPEDLWSKQIVDHWAGIRASTPDYLPLVGPVAKADEFLELYKELALDSKRWIGSAGPYYPGLYVCSGFGARGLTTIPLCSEWLASLINGELGCLPRNVIQALSPARFLRKGIIRG